MSPSEVQLNIESAGRDMAGSRKLVLETARRMGFADADAWGIASAVFEACANALRHGGGARVVLCVRACVDRFEAVVRDSGRGLAACPAEAPMPQAGSHRGRGIPLMHAFMDRVEFESNGGCRVTLVKYLPKAR